ncbi:hypothetical protein BGX31_002574 [Mortierella sp. GBA43]|nr:hypothetical protein BGX31_002574 [Mortierella sp. GBA43]
MDVKMEPLSPVEDKPRAADDVEWITKKVIPVMADQEERACEIFQWDIKDWRTLDKRVTGPEFEIGGYKWQGNNQNDVVSVYLDSAEPREQQDPNWHVCAQFALLMSNPTDPTVYAISLAHHRFTVEEADWGFTRFVEQRRLEVPFDNRGLPLVDKGRTIITAYVRVYEDPTGVLWHNFVNYDSKSVTGFVGLKNQGATCYMNSLLQSLFFTNYFRKAVFEIPTAEDEPSKSVSLALQRVFYQLATNDVSVGTTELTRSFGWNSLESFMQHDVQEFNRVLQDNLEGKMKGTVSEGAIQKLFVGKMKSFIKCINVNFESSRVENFYDIQLNVKGCKTLKDSFSDYVAVETLDEDNKYHAEGHGLQDARKGVTFVTLPPVLHLQLKRFEYDIERDAMVKINDRHEFPLEIDLAEFVEDGEDKAKAGPDGFKYSLHGVLVHSGDLHGGHYFALLKPERDGKWYKFDDDRVTIATMKEVLDENYGSGEPPENLAGMTLQMRQASRQRRFTNAYMLVYIQNSTMDEILKPVTQDDIPEHLRRRMEDERIAMENKRRERDESLLYFNCRVISDLDFKVHDGFDLFDPLSQEAGKLFKVKKADSFASFREVVATAYDRTVDQIRIWTLVKRQNDTIRTDVPIHEAEFNSTMEAIKEKHGTRALAELRCYVEFLDQGSGSPTANAKEKPSANDSLIMIFIKYYDPFTTRLEGVGRMHVQRTAKVGDIVAVLNEKKGFPSSTSLRLCEEIKPTMIEPMKMKSTFQQSEIQGGDIIVFQKELTPKEYVYNDSYGNSQINELKDQNSKASIHQYYEYIFNRIVVEFRPKNDEEGALPTYSIELSKRSTYDQVAAKLAEKLDIDPLHIQFTTASPTGLPKNTIKRSTNLPLQEMLAPGYAHHGTQHNVLYYEKLDMSIVELESKRRVKVTWLGPTMKDESTHELMLLKSSTMEALVTTLLPKVDFKPTGSQKLRIIGVFNGKLVREYSTTDSISALNDQLSIYVEEIPTDELDRSSTEKIIPCIHFQGDPSRAHSIPFKMVIKEGETFSDMKTRIRARLGMAEKDFAKIKFVLCQNGAKIIALNDDDVLSELNIAQGDSIGLDHIDKSGRINRLGLEKAITIRG